MRHTTCLIGWFYAVLLMVGCGGPTAPGGDSPNTVGGSGGQLTSGAGPSGGGGMTSSGGTLPGSGGTGGAMTPGGGNANNNGGTFSSGGLAGSSGSGGGGGAPSVGTGCTDKTLCWNFDDGKTPAGFTPWRTAGTGQLLVDNTKPYGGAGYSLHAKDLQGGPQHTWRYDLPANWGPVMWGRLRLFTTPTRPEAHAGFFNARYPKPGQPDSAPENQLNWYEVASYQQKYMTIWHPPWPPGFPEDVQVSDTMLVIDEWTCVEWFFDGKNDADPMEAALPKAWLDGQELAWPEHFTYSEPAGAPAPFRDKATNFTVIELGIVTWQAVPTPVSWWIDDVALGTERVGCN